MEIKKLRPDDSDDFIDLIKIFKEAFEQEDELPDKEYLSNLLSYTHFLVFVVKTAQKVVGGLTVYILPQYYTTKPLAYIYDVAIAPGFQKKGLGKALIADVCKYCKQHGFDAAYVEAENEDKDAVNFYKRTAFSSEITARHFTYSFSDTA